QARRCTLQYRCQGRFPRIERLAAQIVTVQLDQIEGVQEYARVMAPIPDAVEAGHAFVVAGDRLAVDDARARAQVCQGLDNQREAVGQVVTGAAVEPHALAVLTSDDPESIVLSKARPRRRARHMGRTRSAGAGATL